MMTALIVTVSLVSAAMCVDSFTRNKDAANSRGIPFDWRDLATDLALIAFIMLLVVPTIFYFMAWWAE